MANACLRKWKWIKSMLAKKSLRKWKWQWLVMVASHRTWMWEAQEVAIANFRKWRKNTIVSIRKWKWRGLVLVVGDFLKWNKGYWWWSQVVGKEGGRFHWPSLPSMRPWLRAKCHKIWHSQDYLFQYNSFWYTLHWSVKEGIKKNRLFFRKKS